MPKELARMEISPSRRLVGLATMGGMGAMLIAISVVGPFDPDVQSLQVMSLVIAATGLFQLWLTWRFWRASSQTLTLTEYDLSTSTGLTLCRVEDVQRIDRGTFAFRPSTGFVIICNTKVPRGWAPGLWWGYGRRIGVGGATGREASKHMAEMLDQLLTGRKQA